MYSSVFAVFYSKKIFSRGWFLKYFYLKDQKGILNRYLNEKENWHDHITNTKRYIKERVNEINPKKVAILGSGWLLDVPMDCFISNKIKVDLFDINHPKQIKHKYKKFPFISFIERDLTGGIVEYSRKAQSINDIFNELKSDDCQIDFNSYDLVVSVNLLNQLDVLLCDILKQKFHAKEDDLLQIRRQIQSNHLNSLPVKKSCLITDYCELFLSKENAVDKMTNLVFIDLPKSSKIEEWEWIFDMNMKYRKKYNTIFKVKAISF